MRPNGGLADSNRGARRRVRALRPLTERLEGRQLLAVDLATIASAPVGVEHWGANSAGGAGYSVSDVGDVNGDGYDDYVIGAPVIASSPPYSPSPGSGTGQAFLVFGSRRVNQTAITDFLGLASPQQRTGDLAQLGQASQTNPATGQPGFPFAGIPLTVNDPGANLGVSAVGVGDLDGDGLADFLIGAPGTGNGVGQAYLVYGSRALTALGNTGTSTNLDTPIASVRVQTFTSSLPGGRLGQAVAGVGNFLRDGTPGIAIAAPSATTPAGIVNAGAVYVTSYRTLSTLMGAGPIDVTRFGQSGTTGLNGVRFVGTTLAGNAGLSVASAGNVNGDAAAGGKGDDLLIGEPSGVSIGTSPIVNSGDAYLIYGGPNLQAAQTNLGGGQLGIPLDQIGVSSAVPGARFYSPNSGDRLGFSVSTAGDFNGDGNSDFLIGAPGRNSNAGRATLIYGKSGGAQITGTYNVETLTNPPAPQAALNASYFNGKVSGNLMGYAVSPVGDINGDGLNEIAIGAPGTAGNSGAVFLVPGNPTLPNAAYTLDETANPVAPLFALPIISREASNTPIFLGGSLGARVWPVSTPPIYVDGDAIGDFLIGAPGLSESATSPPRQLAGAAYLVQGAFIRNLLPVPPNLTIPVQIGVGSATAPFSINASTPNALQIWVSSNATVSPAFQPTTMLSNPTTVTVNGVSYSAAVAPDGDFNNDGITDVILTISPRSNLNLTPGSTVTFTVKGQTNETTARLWSGSATVQIARLGPPPPVLPGPGVSAAAAVVSIPSNGEALVPSVQSFSKLIYMPVPASIATMPSKPAVGFSQRLARFYGLVKTSKKHGTKYYNRPDRGNTLGYGVFSRGKFPVGQVRFQAVKTGVYMVPANLNRLPS